MRNEKFQNKTLKLNNFGFLSQIIMGPTHMLGDFLYHITYLGHTARAHCKNQIVHTNLPMCGMILRTTMNQKINLGASHNIKKKNQIS